MSSEEIPATQSTRAPMSTSIDEQWSYTGPELESMAFAMNYRRWIFDVFRPFLGKRIVEVGAGSGSFSELLLATRPEWLDAIEPSANLYPLLAEHLQSIDPGRIGHALRGTLTDTAESIRKTGAPDSVIYVNVLEHIEDDAAELRTIHSLLQPGGHALIFSPAHPWLMGSMDYELGHHRRYTITDLARKCKAAGFTIRLASYFDMMGIAPWWVKYCVLRSRTMEPAAVRFYDRYAVPVSRLLESAIRPPIGRNVILVGQKVAS
jgi:2-polyprenyl-3-methyl-5-hydroxy-6-metoxy-1,4-benzoquinol methylase